jgi:hypothetical protein
MDRAELQKLNRLFENARELYRHVASGTASANRFSHMAVQPKSRMHFIGYCGWAIDDALSRYPHCHCS